MKTCSRCKEEQPKSEFYRQESKSDGLHSHCKSCTSKARAEYRDRNLEKIKRYQSEYYENNKADLVEKAREFRKENPDHFKTDPFVYKIVNKTTKDTYYGSSMCKYRWNSHKAAMNSTVEKKYNVSLYKHMREYGIDNFSYVVMCIYETREEAYRVEEKLIQKHGTLNVEQITKCSILL